MKQSRLVPAALVLITALFTQADVIAQEKEKPAGAPKPVLCAVVQVDGDYQVVLKSELDALKKRLKQDHKQALAAHKEAAKEAKKKKEKFQVPAPKASKVKVVKASIEQSKATAFVAELKAKDSQKAAGKDKPRTKKKPAKSKSKDKRPPKS
ncbi:MAG: hypothetical protein ACJAQZ_003856 [Planctomycetota bacterium]|jgi:hypothetical protein